MSNDYSDIRELIREITERGGLPIMEVEVTGVNDNRTCKVKVIRTGLEVDNVRTQGLSGYTTGIFPKLKQGTIGVMLLLGKVPYFIVTGETDELELNGSQHGGLIVIAELVSKINTIENKVNTILSSYNGHTHADPSSGSTGTTSAPVSGTLTNTQASDIENEKVKHG